MARRSLVGSVSPVYYEGMADLDAMLAFVNELKAVSAVPVLSLSGQACEMHSWGASPLPGENGSMIFGAARDADLCYRCARAASIESKAVGFDCVWSPCADVNTNPRNPIIGTRAFSDRVELVNEMSVVYVRGMQDARVIPNAKHFPGHGDTEFDTHVRVGVIERSREELEAIDLAPYLAMIAAGLRGIMTAHIIYPALDDTPDQPATLSRRCIHGLLREQMGFDGLIVSDSLTMKAIRDHYEVGDAAVRTFQAGHDVLLHDYNEPPQPTFDALLEAARSGAIERTEVDASVMRVLEAKQWAGLHERGPITRDDLVGVFNRDDHVALAREAFEASVTVLEGDALPLDADLAVIATRSEEEGQAATDFAMTIENSRTTLITEIERRLGPVASQVMYEDPSDDQINAAIAAAGDRPVVLFATFPRMVSYKALSGQVGVGQVRLVERLIEQGKRVVLGVFGTPYVIADFPRCAGCLTTYASTRGAVEAAVRVLCGEIPSRGRLPVDIDDRYHFGAGV